MYLTGNHMCLPACLPTETFTLFRRLAAPIYQRADSTSCCMRTRVLTHPLVCTLALTHTHTQCCCPHADTLQRKGLYDPPPGATTILGLEAAGVVEAIGVECVAGYALGDRVMVLVSGGGYAEYVTVRAVQPNACAIPSCTSMSTA
jgi:hypothetical protein